MSIAMLLPLAAEVAAKAADAPAVEALKRLQQLQEDALNSFKSLDFNKLDAEQWHYVAKYYGLRVMFVLVLMTLAWTLSGWASSIVRRGLTRVKFDETLTIFLAKLVRWLILLLVALMCLSKFGVETASFAAVIGAAGLAIGLAFQGTLSNFAAGTMLLIFRPYKIGDTVVVAGHQGTVREIELFTTDIDTPDSRRIIIPNSAIFGAVIENLTHYPVRRTSVTVGTAYSADLDETRKVLERAVRSVTLVVTNPAPEVVLTDLGGSSVNWMVNAWARGENMGQAKQGLLRAIKVELDHAAIGIPFPQMDVHFDHPAVQLKSSAA